MFDMHMSSPVLAFAKNVKESQLGELLEVKQIFAHWYGKMYEAKKKVH